MPSRLGIDIGGSRGDFVLLDETTGAAHSLKRAMPRDQVADVVSQGIADLAQMAGITPGEIRTVVHCWTGPEPGSDPVGLLITQGFEHLLHLQRGQPGGASATGLARHVVARGVAERMSAQGNTLLLLDEEQAHHAIVQALNSGARSIAICLLHAHANPAHELQLEDLVREVSESVPVFLSHSVAPGSGEYERALATVLAASLQAQLSHQHDAVSAGLRAAQISPAIDMALSTGARSTPAQAKRNPAATIVAGPAGASAAAARVASAAGYPDAVMVDMGGGATDLTLIRSGAPRVSGETRFKGDTLAVPAIDIRSAGAGSSATARAPIEGVLRVGPDAAPGGPACRGGSAATLMDAQVVLGRLPADRLGLDAAAAAEAVGTLARTLDTGLHRAAEGIVAVFDETLGAALRCLAIEKGEDPGRLAIVAAGGSGPMHGCSLAALTGGGPVIVPRSAGSLSALGFATARRSCQFTHAVARRLDDLAADDLDAALAGLRADAEGWLAEEGAAGTVHFRAEVAYPSHDFSISTGIDPDTNAMAAMRDALAAQFRRRYGIPPNSTAHLVSLRAIATETETEVNLAQPSAAGRDARAAQIEEIQAWFDGGFLSTPVYERGSLPADSTLRGPALILDTDTTAVIEPGFTARVDASFNLVIHHDGAAGNRNRA